MGSGRCPVCNGEDVHPEARPQEEPQPDADGACARCQNVRYVRDKTTCSPHSLCSPDMELAGGYKIGDTVFSLVKYDHSTDSHLRVGTRGTVVRPSDTKQHQLLIRFER